MADIDFARGEWQVSRVCSLLGRGEPALVRAHLCLDTCVEHGIGDCEHAMEDIAGLL